MRNARVTKRVQEDTSRTNAFETVHDEPPILLGNNAGANPGRIPAFMRKIASRPSSARGAPSVLANARGLNTKAILGRKIRRPSGYP